MLHAIAISNSYGGSDASDATYAQPPGYRRNGQLRRRRLRRGVSGIVRHRGRWHVTDAQQQHPRLVGDRAERCR